jgi:hypothetical protein
VVVIIWHYFILSGFPNSFPGHRNVCKMEIITNLIAAPKICVLG